MNSPTWTCDRKASRAYFDKLNAYMRQHVDDGCLRCRFGRECRLSSRAPEYAEGQLPHLGPHYAMARNGQPWRLVVFGLETGHPEAAHESMETRTRGIIERTGHHKRFYAESGHPPRNPHMKGVTSTLRLWFEKGLGSDYAGEQIRLADSGTPVSVFEACSLPNFLMCSSTEPGRKSRPTKVMKDNCTGHARNVVRILEPTLIVCHGTDVGARVAEAIKTLPKAPPVLTFYHPSYQLCMWGQNHTNDYLVTVVKPKMEAAMQWIMAS